MLINFCAKCYLGMYCSKLRKEVSQFDFPKSFPIYEFSLSILIYRHGSQFSCVLHDINLLAGENLNLYCMLIIMMTLNYHFNFCVNILYIYINFCKKYYLNDLFYIVNIIHFTIAVVIIIIIIYIISNNYYI